MSGRCEECGAPTVWEQDVGSAICLECGTLADPSQNLLTSHFEQADTSGREFAPWANLVSGTTLRGRNGWALSGQGKEARDRQNTIAMHEFIRTIANRLSNPGIASRAEGAFDQAMRAGRYRWGRKAKLTAGAALAIALRESHKSDSIRDIAYLLDEPPSAVTRAFSKVVQLLQLKLPNADPAMHLSALQTHLASLLEGGQDRSADETTALLPDQLKKVLVPLIARLPTITRTATSLSELVVRTDVLAHVPTPPISCALFLLAIEAELSSSLPNAGTLAQALGGRLGAGKGIVMQRYKQIYDMVEEWIRDIPWLESHERKRGKSRETGRSKIAKRVVVARGLKDVVQFQVEIWRKRVESQGRPAIQLDTDGRDGDESGDDWGSSQSASRTSQTLSTAGDDGPRRKKPKTRHPKSVVDASQFLLNPLSSAVPVASSSSSPPDTAGQSDLLTHLLIADPSSLPHAFVHPPTRLQLLASTRGGAEEQHIADDELFAENELEALIRSPEEAAIVRVALGWDRDTDAAEPEPGASSQSRAAAGGTPAEKKKRKRTSPSPDGGGGFPRARGSKRINMDALARLLDPDADLDAECHLPDGRDFVDDDCVGEDGEEGEDGHDDTEMDAYVPPWNPPDEESAVGLPQIAGDEDLEVVEDWRPMSPGGGGCVEDSDWYDLS